MRLIYKVNDFSLPMGLTINNDRIEPVFDSYLKCKFRLDNNYNNLINNDINLVFNEGPSFDNDSAYFDCYCEMTNTKSLLNAGRPFSISLWFKAVDIRTYYLFTNFIDNDIGLRLYLHFNTTYNKGFPVIHIKDNNSNFTYYNLKDYSNAMIELNQWYHIVYTYNGGLLKAGEVINSLNLYINGVLINESLINNSAGIGTVTNFETSYNYFINTYSASNPRVLSNAYYKDFRIYTRELTANEVAAIYNDYNSVVRQRGLFEAVGTFRDVSFLDTWTGTDIDTTTTKFVLLIDGVKSIIDNDGNIVSYDGTNAMTKDILNERLKYYKKRYIQPVIILSSDLNGYDVFDSIQFNYNIEVIKVNKISIDNEDSTKITVYEGEKKFIKFQIKTITGEPIDLTDANLELRLTDNIGNIPLHIYETDDFDKQEASNGILYLYIDTTTDGYDGGPLEPGNYIYQLIIRFGTDYTDKTKIFKIKIKSSIKD